MSTCLPVGKVANCKLKGFTLVELLVVIAIISVLLAVLTPTLNNAKMQARIVQAHAELRNVTLALGMYRLNNDDSLPPTRFSCSTRSAYELPIELGLGSYMPMKTNGTVDVVVADDPFHAGETYKYRAPGPAIMNESVYLEDAATLWIPGNFPNCDGLDGQYYNDAKTSPVSYALWSLGPDPDSAKFDYIPGRGPLPNRFWLMSSSDSGLITHFEDYSRTIRRSP